MLVNIRISAARLTAIIAALARDVERIYRQKLPERYPYGAKLQEIVDDLEEQHAAFRDHRGLGKEIPPPSYSTNLEE